MTPSSCSFWLPRASDSGSQQKTKLLEGLPRSFFQLGHKVPQDHEDSWTVCTEIPRAARKVMPPSCVQTLWPGRGRVPDLPQPQLKVVPGGLQAWPQTPPGLLTEPLCKPRMCRRPGHWMLTVSPRLRFPARLLFVTSILASQNHHQETFFL